jgi:hypothetical protein
MTIFVGTDDFRDILGETFSLTYVPGVISGPPSSWVINRETWSSGLVIGRKADDLAL